MLTALHAFPHHLSMISTEHPLDGNSLKFLSFLLSAFQFRYMYLSYRKIHSC